MQCDLTQIEVEFFENSGCGGKFVGKSKLDDMGLLEGGWFINIRRSCANTERVGTYYTKCYSILIFFLDRLNGGGEVTCNMLVVTLFSANIETGKNK